MRAAPRLFRRFLLNYMKKATSTRALVLSTGVRYARLSISDAEVEHEDQDRFFWASITRLLRRGKSVEIATTRPETLLGDTAVAVKPDDERATKTS